MRLRTNDTYEVEHEGKFIKSSKIISKNVTDLLPIALAQGELTAAQILDIDQITAPDDEEDGEPDLPQFEVQLLKTNDPQE